MTDADLTRALERMILEQGEGVVDSPRLSAFLADYLTDFRKRTKRSIEASVELGVVSRLKAFSGAELTAIEHRKLVLTLEEEGGLQSNVASSVVNAWAQALGKRATGPALQLTTATSASAATPQLAAVNGVSNDGRLPEGMARLPPFAWPEKRRITVDDGSEFIVYELEASVVSLSKHLDVEDNVIRDAIYLSAADGTSRIVRLRDFDIICGPGHELTFEWAVKIGQEYGPYIAVQNQTTSESYRRPELIAEHCDLPEGIARLSTQVHRKGEQFVLDDGARYISYGLRGRIRRLSNYKDKNNVVHAQITLKTSEGVEQLVRFASSEPLDCAEGHELALQLAVKPGEDHGPYIAFNNLTKSTGFYYFYHLSAFGAGWNAGEVSIGSSTSPSHHQTGKFKGPDGTTHAVYRLEGTITDFIEVGKDWLENWIILKALDGTKRIIRMRPTVDMAPGHKLTLHYAVKFGSDRGSYVIVKNETTAEIFYDDYKLDGAPKTQKPQLSRLFRRGIKISSFLSLAGALIILNDDGIPSAIPLLLAAAGLGIVILCTEDK